MKLSYLIKECTPVWTRSIDPASDPDTDPEITSIHASAQDVIKGGLFIAIKGFQHDGHDYIDRAVANGASAIITDTKRDIQLTIKDPLATKYPVVAQVKDTRKAMSSIASRFYGNPSGSMVLTGITGTNGKTTTAWLLENIFNEAGFETGVIGTLNYRYKGQTFDNPVTTPESIDLHRILSDMKNQGVTHVIMEVSSHAIDLHRVRECAFDVAIFTNLTRDHLDYHKNMGAYFACKKRLFTKLLKRGGKNGKSVINIEDDYGKELSSLLPADSTTVTCLKADNHLCATLNGLNTKNHLCTEARQHKRDNFSGKKEPTATPSMVSATPSMVSATSSMVSATPSMVSASDIEDDIKGLKGNIHIDRCSFSFSSNLAGDFNLENILCAAGAAHALGVDTNFIKSGIESCHGVPGRLERVENRGNRHIFVDYAHTPDALESILKTLKMRAPARLITICGCGGDRDRTKRPIMGEIAARYSDILIVTSDNPRTEDPDSIIADIMDGVNKVTPSIKKSTAETSTLSENKSIGEDKTYSAKELIIEPDRQKALEMSVALSKPGDIIIAAGKGHETYQIIKSGKIDFDDRLILRQAATIFDAKPFCQSSSNRKEKSSSNRKEKYTDCDFSPIAWSFYDISQALDFTDQVNMENESENKNFIFQSASRTKDALKNKIPCFKGVSTDSRITEKDDIFLALKGENFDAHDFIPDLVKKGVKAFIVDKTFLRLKGDAIFFRVNNTLEALGMLARYQRIRSGVQVLAITGSNGKTTTRKMAASIFSQKFRTLSTSGNFNNEVGLPLTLLKLSGHHEWAVVEMGMNHPGEISRLSKIAMPDIAIITNTADAHLEGMGNRDNVAMAKAEISEGMKDKSTLIINGNDPSKQIILKKRANNPRVSNTIFFGTQLKEVPDIEIKGENNIFFVTEEKKEFTGNGISFTISTSLSGYRFKNETLFINSPATFMLDNALAACSAALAAGISISEIKDGLSIFQPVKGRMNIIKKGHLTLIDDTYNANPASVKGAIATLQKLSSGKEAIAVLGDMLELGEQSPALHFSVGEAAANASISRLYTSGERSEDIIKGALHAGLARDVLFNGTKSEITKSLTEYIEKSKKENAKEICILIKGSRGMKMEEILNTLLS
ncbi:putative UDP-N-acetylmuramoyl-tripeptide--D-alanyl-D-alanine ligase [Desulfamplus magnetovallimortis]|uniref:Multifunctional fusion protein n=1 Tax=Desulfamplus magnetovallimortis TaxID=1246637 RepID=A0A1W1HE87_9BACT|nr:UDP-N-acetylmuramoyl-tripeptide--D-alanyl-D-alanine ligase [Desulfamplus magnetovallimortis]SLM30692.1 putative UDP-N-acetylmuramoyl-tripeptide--D-alanyl-D-alanine ligase [Desulfamplus magnetovallimortis]